MARIRAGEIYINYEQQGHGTDLVLTHGLGGSLHSWDEQLEDFAKHHRVTLWDARGFGKSDKPPGPYSPSLFAKDLAALLDVLEIRRAHFLGISMGGVIVQRFALDYPQFLRSVVLISTSSEVGEAARKGWQRQADLVEEHGFSPELLSVDSRAVSPRFRERHAERLRQQASLTAQNDPKAYAAAARAMSDYNWTEELAELAAPALILQGQDDALTPPGGSVIMHRRIPFSRLLFIPDCGHSVPLEQPEVFLSASIAFMAGVDFAGQAWGRLALRLP